MNELSSKAADIIVFAEQTFGAPLTPWQRWLIELAFADADQPKIWASITVAEVRPGDVIRMPGKAGSERTVAGVSPVMLWHVHPAASPYAPQEKRAEWSELKIKFRDIAEPFSFTDPDFAVEIETTQTEADAVKVLGGWGSRK